MLRNNIIALIIHVLMICTFTLCKWDKLSSNLNFVYFVYIALIVLSTYMIIGFFVLKDMGSLYKNLLSTIAIILLGIIIWGVCFFKVDYNSIYNAFGDDGYVCEWWIKHDREWVYFDAYRIPAYIATFPVEFILLLLYTNGFPMIIIEIVNIFYVFIPSLILCFGIFLRKKFKYR